MMRQSSSRNQRSKGGVRLKYVLQICILLAICTWLIYQVKHSHDKKRAFEERITKITTKVTDQKQPDLFNFGRKGLPLVKENDSADSSVDTTLSSKNEDNEEGQEEEEGEQEHDMKQEEAEDEEGKRDGDAIDELDQDRGDEENEQEVEFTGEEEDGQVEEDGLFDNQENEDSAQEAREEHYKRDDASSAVAHDTHVMEPETGAADARGLDEEHMVNPGIEDAEVENMETAANGTVSDAKIHGYSILGNVASMSNLSNVAFSENMTVPNADLAMNGSHSETIGPEVELPKPENGTISSSVSTEGSSQKELQPNTTITTLPENNTEVAAIHTTTLPENNMEIATIHTTTLPENNAEVVAIHTANVSDRLQNYSTQNDSVSMKETPRDGKSISIPVQGQNTSLVIATSGEGVVVHHEKSDTSERHESEDHPITSATSENGATTQADPGHLLHNAVTASESEVRTDLSTLPDIQNVVKQHDDETAE